MVPSWASDIGSDFQAGIKPERTQKGETKVKEKVPVPVRVRRKEQEIEIRHDIRDLPPDWRPEPVPRRWKV